MSARGARRAASMSEGPVGRAIQRLFEVAAQAEPDAVSALVDVVRDVVGARTARLFVADYGLRQLQQVDSSGRVGASQPIDGTLAGRAFANNEVVSSGGQPTVLWVPLVDRTDRLGLLELAFDVWDGVVPTVMEPVVTTLVLLLVSRLRYTDLWDRARRAEPLTPAAEVQWDLLPPLACATNHVSVGGIVEPAYEIGGDSFDYAINGRSLDFAIVDAIGRGMSAVLMSAAAVNSLRNVRREGGDLAAAYKQADDMISNHFGNSFYVTGQFGALDLSTGILKWINAGHVLPMLVRNGGYVGELVCAPSLPMGLGGPVAEVASEHLQAGDRVLFYTDGITESRAPDGSYFGTERLADFLVRASYDALPAAETARRLSASVMAHVEVGLNDDASLFLIEYQGGGFETPPETSGPDPVDGRSTQTPR